MEKTQGRSLILGVAAVVLGILAYGAHLIDERERAVRIAEADRAFDVARAASISPYANLATITRLAQASIERALAPALDQDQCFTAEPMAQIRQLLIGVITTASDVDHIRLLNLDGMEQIRVNRLGPDVYVVPQSELQDKRSRYYIQDLIKTQSERVYFSPRDLNVEQGVVEARRAPMLRTGVKIRDSNGEPRALLVINFRAPLQINPTTQVNPAFSTETYAINAQGEFIHGGSRFADREFGWLVNPDMPNFAETFPELWRAVSNTSSGSLELADGLYRWQTTDARSFMDTFEAQGYSQNMPFTALVQFLPKAYLNEGSLTGTVGGQAVIGVMLLLMMTTIIGVWRLNDALYKASVARQHAENESRRADDMAHRENLARKQAEDAERISNFARQKEEHARQGVERALEAAEYERKQAVIAKQQADFSRFRSDKAKDDLESEIRRRMRLLATVSHELRTPAATISMLLDEPGDMTETRVAEIKRLNSHLLRLMDDLRMIGKPGSPSAKDFRSVLPSKLFLESKGQTESILEQQTIQVHIDVPSADDYPVMLDAYRLSTIVSNLLRNAALHSGGHNIWLSSRFGSEKTQENKLLLYIRVEDDGKGIPQEQRDHVFDEFFRGTTNAEGMGLGLTIVQEWVQGMGGSIAYFVSEHGGAGFEIVLAVDIAQVPTEAESPVTVSQHTPNDLDEALKNRRILVVEDDSTMRRATQRLLKRYGADVSSAVNGKEALAEIDTKDPELVITDYFMPEMDGAEMIKTLRQQHDARPIIAVTAATLGVESDELMEAGADAVMGKPLNIEELAGVLHRLQPFDR